MPPLQGLQNYNDKMVVMAEHWDEFIMNRQLTNPNIWHDRIPRGSYELFKGTSQKSNVYRGGLPVQAGLSTWKAIQVSRKPSDGDPGFDNCAPGTPHTYSYAWETIEYSGFQDEWQSEPVCLNDLKFVDFAKDQLALIVRSGVDYGISILENWNREKYVQFAADSGRFLIHAEGAINFEDDSTLRVAYDPFLTTADIDGALVPYIAIDPSIEVSSLNWTTLDYLRTNLAERAGAAAIASDSGMPMFGLMIDIMDFERMITADAELKEDFRYAVPSKIIEGYDFGLKSYRGFVLMHDARQMRFRYMNIDSDGNAVFTRVLPLRAGRAVTIGNIPEPNPGFYRAELGVGVIFLNEIFQNLFVPSIDSLGSGMRFGPAPGLTGEWEWINIRDNNGNQLGESGYFYGRFQVYPKPLLYASEATVFLYRRCAHSLKTECYVQSRDDVGTGAIALASDAVSADFDDTNNRVTVTLASKLDAGINDPVSVAKADATAFAGRVVSDALAPTYVIAWLEGAANEPTAYTDFTAAAATVTVS